MEFERITFDPSVMGGKACIRGLRVTVSLVVNLVANGMSHQEIIEAYPSGGGLRSFKRFHDLGKSPQRRAHPDNA